MYVKLHDYREYKKPNEIHKNLIPTKINYHIIQYKLLYTQQQTQTYLNYNWPDFLAI